MVHCARKNYQRAVELFEAHDTPAFGDAATAAYMQRTDTEYLYSFDSDDFGSFEWVTRLDTANNPFS